MLEQVPLPMLEQILVFGQSQVTTQLIRACFWRKIPIVYLSRIGRCYGRMLPIERGYRSLSQQQQRLSEGDLLQVAQNIVRAKLKNSRVMLRRQASAPLDDAIQRLTYLMYRVEQADSTERLPGFKGLSNQEGRS